MQNLDPFFRDMLSFAEVLVFLGAVALITSLLRPLQRFLEPRIQKILDSKRKSGQVIDITDYPKKDKNS